MIARGSRSAVSQQSGQLMPVMAPGCRRIGHYPRLDLASVSFASPIIVMSALPWCVDQWTGPRPSTARQGRAQRRGSGSAGTPRPGRLRRP